MPSEHRRAQEMPGPTQVGWGCCKVRTGRKLICLFPQLGRVGVVCSFIPTVPTSNWNISRSYCPHSWGHDVLLHLTASKPAVKASPQTDPPWRLQGINLQGKGGIKLEVVTSWKTTTRPEKPVCNSSAWTECRLIHTHTHTKKHARHVPEGFLAFSYCCILK